MGIVPDTSRRVICSATIFQRGYFLRTVGRHESIPAPLWRSAGSPVSGGSMLLKSTYENQDALFAAAFSVLEAALTERAFPAASLAVTHRGQLIAHKAFGNPVYEKNHEGAPSKLSLGGDFDFPITPTTIFDLASLTKVVATTTMAMILYERGLLELNASVVGIVPEFASDSGPSDASRREVTFRMLLAHSSGLPAYEKLFLKAHSREELLHAAFTTRLSADPDTRAEYSDIGFIVLGTALERIAKERLDVFCRREIFGPLGVSNTTFNPPTDMRPQIPPTADERSDLPAPPSTNFHSTFRNRIRTKMRSCWAEWHLTRACSRRRKISRDSLKLCCKAEPGSFAPKPFPSSRAANPRLPAHPARLVGIRRRIHRNPENISVRLRSATSATPEHRYGSIQSGSFPLLC